MTNTTTQSTIPELTSHDGDDQRVERLQSVWSNVVARAEFFGNTRLERGVARLHDHKGCLEVYWSITPAGGEKLFFADAWEGHAEPRGCVEHHVTN